MAVEYFRTLIDYNFGENRKVWDGCIVQLSDDQFYRDVGYSHGSIHEELVHVMSGDWWWLSRAKGQSPQTGLKATDYPTRASIRARWDEIEADARAFVNHLDDASLASAVQYTNPRGEVIDNHVWTILLHLCNHGLIHRAEIFAIAHQVGGPTFDLSMMRYLYDGRY